MKSSNENLVCLIMEAIDELGITRRMVAKQLGMSPQQFSNILSGVSPLPVKYFKTIALYLLIDDADLKRAFIADYTQCLEYAIQDRSK